MLVRYRLSSGLLSPLSDSLERICAIAKEIAAPRTILYPMRAIAVRSSTIGLPLRLIAAELPS